MCSHDTTHPDTGGEHSHERAIPMLPVSNDIHVSVELLIYIKLGKKHEGSIELRTGNKNNKHENYMSDNIKVIIFT